MPGRVHYYCPDDLHKYPLVSPIFQTNFSNLPPLLMQLGTAERLYGEGVAFCKRVSKNESAVALQTYHSHVHVFQIFSFITGSKKAILDGADWIKQRFGGVPTTEENYFTKFDFNGQFIAQEILE